MLYGLADVEMFFKLGSRALEMLQAPLYLNSALTKIKFRTLNCLTLTNML